MLGRWHRAASGSRCFLLFETSDLFFHLLARLECYDVFLWNVDALTGAWVASFAGGALLHFKHTKVSQFNPALQDRTRVRCRRFRHDRVGYRDE